jgi:glutamate/tyrosine decarboxylase-like PLP-dependent enzyme
MTDWPGGLYCSPSFAGSRPGALSAAAWAAMVSIGEEGYLDAVRRILTAAGTIKDGLRDNDDVQLMGDSLFVIALQTPELDVYRVNDAMTQRGWALNPLHRPAAVHLCVTLRHTQPGVAERFVEDLRDSIAWVRENPSAQGGMAPIYGMANTLPERGPVAEAMLDHMDSWYRLG